MRRTEYKLSSAFTVFFILFYFVTQVSAQTNEREDSSGRGTPQAFSGAYEKAKKIANEHTVSIIGGSLSGTYTQFSTDMANVLNEKSGNGLRILPIVGLGGGQNLKDIMFLRGIDMGITQSEHMAYLKKQDPALFSNMEKHVRYIAKLYNSEFHVVARKDIKSLKDLEGQTVNLWEKISATDIGGQTIFDILGIKVNYVYIDPELAIEKVKSGEIAATTLLAGAPINKFQSIKASDNLHLVPVGNMPSANGDLLDTFLPAKLKSEDYPNLIAPGSSISTVASSAILAVYNWPEGTERYKKLEIFVEKFFNNISELQKAPRHPKWKEINLAATVPGWTRFAPAEKALQNPVAPMKQTAKEKDFEDFLQKSSGPGKRVDVSSLNEQQRQQLYAEFLDWMKQQKR